MHDLAQALKDVCRLHEQVAQLPAPEIGPQHFLPFPPGVDPVAFAIHEVGQLKQLVESRAQMPAPPQWIPRASVFSGDTAIRYLVELPGVQREDVSVVAVQGELVVRGQRPQPADPNLKPMLVEQPWGTFERRFALPAWCTPDGISARYSQGVLEITLSRNEDSMGEFRVQVG
jgi:HSP20 family molecular chaperone IbpA